MRSAKSRLPAIFARLALIFLIQCPLPVCHAHGLTTAEMSSIPALPEHARRFHDGRSQVSAETLGWHVHVLPPLGTPGDQRGDDPEAPDVDLTWRSDSDSDRQCVQLVRLACGYAAASIGRVPSRSNDVEAAPRSCDTFGEICRRQRQAILRA